MYQNGICFITDPAYSRLTALEMVRLVLQAGITFIQYRAKDSDRRQIYHEAMLLRDLTRRSNAVLIINDHADIALAVDADGVHLGQDDLPLKEARKMMGNRIIGISTHDLSQAADAEAGGADYIGFGPLFQTDTKDAGAPKGVDILMTIKQNVTIPVVAIGGINVNRVSAVMSAGADAVAVASAICRGDIRANSEEFVKTINGLGRI